MFKKIYDNFEEVFCAVTVAVMVLCLMLQVLIRAFSGSALAWTEELSRYSFLWTVYMGAALVAKHNGHVRITAQFMLLPLKGRLLMRLVADIIWFGFTLFIAWQSWIVIYEGMEFPEISPTLHIMKSYVEMIIPVGFVLMAWRIVDCWLRHWRAGTLTDLVRVEGE